MRVSPTGISMDDGRYTYQSKDLSIGSLALERSYISGPDMAANRFFGPNWTHNYDMSLVSNCPSTAPCATVVIGRTTYKFLRYGSAGSYQWIADGTAVGTTLTFDGTTYLLVDRQGTRYQFTSSVTAFSGAGQRVATVTEANGAS